MKLWVPDVPDPRLIDSDQEVGQWTEIIREVYEMDNYTYKGCKIEPGDVFVDVGANIGLWSRRACEHGAKGGYAYEPNRANFDCLLYNTDGLHVQPVLRAVTSEPGPVTLFCGSCIGGHTIINLDRGDVPISVFGITIDLIFTVHHLMQLDFLKIDCEGAEVGVLDGISDLNLARVRKLALEFHHWIERFDNAAKEKILNRLTASFRHVEERRNPGGEQTMIYCWR